MTSSAGNRRSSRSRPTGLMASKPKLVRASWIYGRKAPNNHFAILLNHHGGCIVPARREIIGCLPIAAKRHVQGTVSPIPGQSKVTTRFGAHKQQRIRRRLFVRGLEWPELQPHHLDGQSCSLIVSTREICGDPAVAVPKGESSDPSDSYGSKAKSRSSLAFEETRLCPATTIF